jgi:hypothetical protein
MSRTQLKDYNLEVLRGNIPGHSMVSMRGHDVTVPNGGPFGLSAGFGVGGYQFDQSALDTTPAAVAVASEDANDTGAGTGARTVIISGLDSSGAAQTAIETLNGITEVTTSETWSAVMQVQVLTVGSGNANAGMIWVGTGSFTSGIPAVRMLSMQTGYNISLSGYYVVPAGKTAYPRQFLATVGSANKDVEVFIETSPNGAVWYTQGPFGLEAGDFTTDVVALPGFPAGTHVRLNATGGSADSIVTGIVAFEVVDN